VVIEEDQPALLQMAAQLAAQLGIGKQRTLVGVLPDVQQTRALQVGHEGGVDIRRRVECLEQGEMLRQSEQRIDVGRGRRAAIIVEDNGAGKRQQVLPNRPAPGECPDQSGRYQES
jgi:hypothetical protein